MDLILTPLVTRLLKQYVKRSAEGAGTDLKVPSCTACAARLPARLPAFQSALLALPRQHANIASWCSIDT